MGKRKTPPVEGATTSTAPENRAPEERTRRGHFRRGVSGNPGGIPRAAVDLRRRLMAHLEDAEGALLDLMEDEDWKARAAGLSMLFERTLGRPSPASELPSDTEIPSPGDASPKGLLDRALALLERSIATAEAQVSSGLPLSEAQRQTLREDAQTLTALAKEERELSKQASGANLSDAELKAAVMGGLSAEELEAELLRRKERAA